MGEVGRIALIADSQDALTAYPDALRFIIAVKRRRDPCRRDLLLQECGPLPAQIRRGTFADENGLESDGLTPGLTLLESPTPIYRAATSRTGSRILRSSSRAPHQGHNLAHGWSNPYFRVNAPHLSERSYRADRRLRLCSSLPNHAGCAAMPRGIDRPMRWSLPKVADFTASS
jgi:hypothetical protein